MLQRVDDSWSDDDMCEVVGSKISCARSHGGLEHVLRNVVLYCTCPAVHVRCVRHHTRSLPPSQPSPNIRERNGLLGSWALGLLAILRTDLVCMHLQDPVPLPSLSRPTRGSHPVGTLTPDRRMRVPKRSRYDELFKFCFGMTRMVATRSVAAVPLCACPLLRAHAQEKGRTTWGAK